ncbi:MAG: hypothetical protein LBG92_01835 [Prevotellaceae bacterium]|jgi:hypothetical protein|nr:hypothetical protein [Prevotellaceae bacterium]
MRIRSKNVPAGQNFHNRRRAIALPADFAPAMTRLKKPNLHNRRRAIALPAAKNDNNRLPERQNSIAKALKFCLSDKDENDCTTANCASLVCGYEN